MVERVFQVIGELLGADRDRVELGARQLRLRFGDCALVVVGHVERERVGAQRVRGQLRRDAEHRARIQAAAQVARHRHVGAQPQPDGLLRTALSRSTASRGSALRVTSAGG
jgi:hypothetical protein